MLLATALAGHPPGQAALPTLRAATDPGVAGAEFYGPSLPGGTRGRPVCLQPAARAHDDAQCRRLWEESERLTEVRYEL